VLKLPGELARPEGLEPPAYWFEANRSIQLSYGRVNQTRNFIILLNLLAAQYVCFSAPAPPPNSAASKALAAALTLSRDGLLAMPQ
jgi:hypothetical protein